LARRSETFSHAETGSLLPRLWADVVFDYVKIKNAEQVWPMRRPVALYIFALLTFACSTPTLPDPPPGAIRVTGTVHFYTLEGGFWAVQGDDRVIYDPLNGLPLAFQRENLRVVMIATARNDLAGVHMVGPIVEVLQIQRL
jgi:hypothetical protein